MVTGEWLDSWTGVIFFAFFRWPKASVAWISSDYFESSLLPQLLRGENDSKQSDEFQAKASAKRTRSPRLSPQCASLAPRFPASLAQKGEQIAPVLHVSEWYPFLTCSEESLCIKVDPECGVLNVDKKAGTFTSDYFRWRGFRSETTIRKYTSAYAGPYLCECEIAKNGEKFQFLKIPGYVSTRPGISIPIKARYPVVWRWTVLWQICWEFRKIYSYTDLAWQVKLLYWCLVLMCLARWALFVDILRDYVTSRYFVPLSSLNFRWFLRVIFTPSVMSESTSR